MPRTNNKTTVLRSAEDRPNHKPTTEQLIALSLLLDASLSKGYGFYVKQNLTTGGFKLKVYTPDEALEDYWQYGENAVEALEFTANAVFGQELATQLVDRLSASSVERAAKAVRSTAPASHPKSGVDRP